MRNSLVVERRVPDSSGVDALTTKIMVVAIIAIILVLALMFLLHRFAKWFLCRRQETGPTRRLRRFDFEAGRQELVVATILHKGLDPSVLKCLPIVIFSQKDFKDGLECAVCLCAVSDGEKTRILPKCSHGFHVDCIDMWFQSHSTCPLCRNPISSQSSSNSCSSDSESTTENVPRVPIEENAPTFPTNVLFWGNETQIRTFCPLEEVVNQSPNSQPPYSSPAALASASSSVSDATRPEEILVVDIPRQINDEEGSKSPMPARLRSFKRLLSRDRRVNPSSPRDFDVEQGARPLC